MPISSNDIRFYLSGGPTNSNPIDSRGGEISSSEIINDALQNIFDNVTKVQADNGLVEYRCVYIKNNGNELWKNVGVWLQEGTPSEDDAIAIGIGSAAINGTEPGPTASETTVPTGNIIFASNTKEENAFVIGDMAPGAYKSIWLKRTVLEGSGTYKRNYFVVRVQPTNPAGGGGSGGMNCNTGYHWDTTIQQCVPDCPIGYHWDFQLNQCVIDTGGGSCPSGYHWDVTLQRCVINTGGEQQGQLDSNGIMWFVAKGPQYLIEQSRTDPGDFRWSEVFPNADAGWEVTGIGTFSGVTQGDSEDAGHFALKHWGGNHSGSCQYEEDGECCCWYDTGIRETGNIQLQIERPHPNNDDFTLPASEQFITNIGMSMNDGPIGLKWVFYPLIYPGGNADNGGIRLKMWVDTDPLGTDGRPKNNWRLVYDFIDNTAKGILTDYPAPEEQEIEVRNSDTDDTEFYAGGIHARRIRRPDDLLPGTGGGGGGGGGTQPPTCPTGQHWDTNLQRCVVDSQGGGGTPTPDFIFAVLSDTTCGSVSENLFSLIEQRNPARFIHTGDTTHSADLGCYFDFTQNMYENGQIKGQCVGNHDGGEEESESVMRELIQHFGLSQPYHSFEYRNVHVLVLYPYSSFGYGSSSAQYNFARTDLQTARANAAIDWIIVAFHKPIYADCTDHGPESAFRDLYHPLFDLHKVDLVVSGHNHQYSRSYPLKHSGGANPTNMSTLTNNYQDLVNPIFLVCGSGGRAIDGFSCTASYNVEQIADYGYVVLAWSNSGKVMTIRRYNDNDEMVDECMVSKTGGSAPPPPPPTGGGGTLPNDQFGVRKIYPTKQNGDEWFFSATNPFANGRFNVENAQVVNNQDGSYTIYTTTGTLRLGIYTTGNSPTSNLAASERNNSPPMTSFDFDELETTGYWYQARDWKNVEFTVYYSIAQVFDTSKDILSLVVRSVNHTTDAQEGCGGSSYHFDISYIDGRVRFKKESYHANYTINNFTETNIGSSEGKWIGMKGIIYNMANGQVKLELWVDRNDSNEWVKMIETSDNDNWGNDMAHCGGNPDGKSITWGSPVVFIKYENSVFLRDMSVREISPPS